MTASDFGNSRHMIDTRRTDNQQDCCYHAFATIYFNRVLYTIIDHFI